MRSASAVSGRAVIGCSQLRSVQGAERPSTRWAPCLPQVQAAQHACWKPAVRGPRPLAVALDHAALDTDSRDSHALELLEQLHGSRSLADATGLLVKAVGAGLSWSDAVEALTGAPEAFVTHTESQGTPVPLHVAFPAAVLECGEPAPVVVVLHRVRAALERCARTPHVRGRGADTIAHHVAPFQLFGLRQRDADICAALSRAGCVAVAPDLHAGLPHAPLERLFALGRLDPTSTASTIHRLLAWIEEQPWGSQRPSLSVLGSGSFGGGAALHFASQSGEAVDAVITVDGAVMPRQEVASLVCPVLGLFTDAQEHAAGRALQQMLQLSSVPVTLRLLDHEHTRPADKLDSITDECLRFLERNDVVGPPTAVCKWGL